MVHLKVRVHCYCEFLEGIASTDETTTPVSIEEMIAEGESAELEFKSTLRWDLRRKLDN